VLGLGEKIGRHEGRVFFVPYGLPGETVVAGAPIVERIRDAQLHKIPYMLVVGEREAQNGTASLRRRTGEDVGAVPLDQIVSGLTAGAVKG